MQASVWTSLTVIKHSGVLVFLFFFKSVFLGPFKKKLLLYLISAVLGLRGCAWTFPSCRERGLLPRWGVWTSHCSGFSRCGGRALERGL